jgi:hypothetical protein
MIETAGQERKRLASVTIEFFCLRSTLIPLAHSFANLRPWREAVFGRYDYRQATGFLINLCCPNILNRMKHDYTAVIKQDEGWWIGWVEEIPGINSQGKTRAELLRNLRSTVKEALHMKRANALS